MSEEKNYYAFISYKREDEKEAKRLQHQLEYYQLPNQLRKDNPDLPEYVRPVFRDMTDLEVGELSALIHEALEQSHYLIVVCSPRAAQSKWVNDEVEYFISLGKQDKIIPYIIEGVPHADDSSEECYPPALLQLSKEKELLGANINEVGKEAAGIRVVSKMFGIRFDMLYQRYNRIKKRKRVVVFTLGLLGIILVMTLLGYVSYAHQQEEYKEFEKRVFAYSLVQGYTDNFLIPLLNTFDDSATMAHHVLIYIPCCYSEIVSYKFWKSYDDYIESAYGISYSENFVFPLKGRRREIFSHRKRLKDYNCMLYTDNARTVVAIKEVVDYKQSQQCLFSTQSQDEMIKEYTDLFIEQTKKKLEEAIPNNPYRNNVHFITSQHVLDSVMNVIQENEKREE